MGKKQFGDKITKFFKYSLLLAAFDFAIFSYILFGDVAGNDLKIVINMLYIFVALLLATWLGLFVSEIYYLKKFKDKSRLGNLVFIVAIFLMMAYGLLKSM